ncbi:MAG: NHLP bacteriocin system secretion protein [Desulfocucumaceae bacterium]
MKGDLFRKVSLDKLSSPEQLDKLITVTTPKAWLSLLAIGFILAAAVVWGVFGSIPTKISGQGILIKGGGIFNVVHSAIGQITDIRVAAGDRVKAGDVVARIDQPELIVQINDEKTRLGQLKNLKDQNERERDNFPAGLYEFSDRLNQARSYLAIQEADYQGNIKKAEIRQEQANAREINQRDRVNKLTQLFNVGAVSKDDLLQAEKDLELCLLDVRDASVALDQLAASYSANIQKDRNSLSLLEGELSTMITDSMDKINRLQDLIDSNSSIVTQISGRVLEVKVNRGDVVQPGTPLVSLEREGKTVMLEVVMYVPAEDGKKIMPGMEAQVSPTTVKKEEHGFMLGKVVSVSEYPSTMQGMMLVLGNQELAAKLAGQGAPLEVRINVISDDETVSGYKWSSSQGPPLKINSGTLCSGSVTVSKVRPISMVIPILKKTLSL